jgi:RNA polymerase sigma-70 factor, ECF subfamily
VPEPCEAPADGPDFGPPAPDGPPADGVPADVLDAESQEYVTSSSGNESAHAASSDAELLRKHVAGDPDAFGELFLRHRDRLWAVAIRTLSDPEDAADALQDAMISAFRRADSFRGDSAVTTWLHRIVVNACLDRMRRRAARPVVSGGDERLLDSAAASGTVIDPSSDSDLSLDVMAALRRLPHDQQIALVLVDMLGYPVADAAEVLSVSQGTVKSRCARGRARLLPRLAYLRHPDKTEQSGAVTQPGFSGQAEHSERAMRNRSVAGAVLPAQEGGDEAP